MQGSDPPPEQSPRGLRRLLRQSEIQPDRRQNQTRLQKFARAIDIFSYIPVPQSYPVSTKKSRLGSIVLILLFLGYIIYDLVVFVTNNAPRINSYLTGIQSQYPVPQMAIGFIYGANLNMTLNDPNYFTIQALEINTTQGKGIPSNLSLTNCPQLPWLNGLQTFYQNLSCLNSSEAQLSGVLYASNVSFYPRFVVNLCNNSAEGNTCVNDSELYNMTSGGRIFLFMEKSESVNLATSESSPSQFGSVDFFNYFIVPQVYGRVVITLQPVKYIVYPDYLRTWTVHTEQTMVILNTQYQISNVSIFNPYNMFSISVVLSSQGSTVQVVYSTLIEHVSLWGAFWGVLFGVFAIVLLTYNKNQFYVKRPEWRRFQDKIDQLGEQRDVINRQLESYVARTPEQIPAEEVEPDLQ